MKVETSDEFGVLLFEEAKAFLARFRAHTDKEAAVAYLHAALLLGYGALEAHINNIAADFTDRPEFTILEQSILQERDIILRNGQFELSSALKMFRLEDRYEFIYRRFRKQPLNKADPWWCQLKAGLVIRNGITHPREPRSVTEKDIADSLNAVLEAIDVLFQAVYEKPYPGKGRRLDSLLDV